ncbi:Serine/threonine protein kinase [Phytophthora megakarya]|uniref:Serine/threonine protein kinase n=1 Tax=Phytophthora megakarya TaxID=4795 RepID=A0A225X2P6_9STRA|nr:Serine/threonine protein kinase [Phytophthora megakarya]
MCNSGRVGKEAYMAPEIVAGESYDPALADVWSLGIMWFVMLTGSPLMSLAVPSEKAFGALEKHGVGVVLEIWGHKDRISRSTISLLDKVLQINPRQRIALDQLLAHPVFSAVETER